MFCQTYNHGGALSEAGITGYLITSHVFRVEVRKTVTSTNTVLREMAAKGAPEGLVLAADEQTAGKGRSGRSFYSPDGHGVYFSLLLRPRLKAGDAALITPAAAVAAALSIEEIAGVRTGIKWVNDLFCGGRKVCGILTEASFDMRNDLVESAILGVGINVTAPEAGFPEELSTVAAAVTDGQAGNNDLRCRLIAAVLDTFWHYYLNLPAREFLGEYRARSIVIDRDICVLSGDGGRRPARALAIDDDCRLIVRFGSGETAALDSGEVSVTINN